MVQKKRIIALDVGSYSAKVAVATVERDRVQISRLESFRMPSGERAGIDTLRPWMEKNGLTNTTAVISLSGKDVIFQPFQLVPADPRTSEQAAAMEVLKFNEMASENMIFDFSEFRLGKDDRRLLLSIARPSLLDMPLALAAARSLQVEDIVPAPVALFNWLAREYSENEKLTLYIDAGHNTTSLSVGLGRQLIFARAFSCGGGLFTAAIAESMGVPAAQADNAKLAAGSMEAGTPHAAALVGAAERWFTELNSCLAVFRNLFPSSKSKIEKIVLTGGASRLEGLPAFLESKMGVSVAVPGTGSANETGRNAGHEYAVCIGLAYSLADDTPAGISLLPEPVREEIASRRQRPFWYASAAAAALILAVSLGGGYIQLKRTQGILNKRQQDRIARRELASEIVSVRMKNERIKQMAAPLTGLLKSTPVMTSILKTVAENRGADEWITVVCDSASYFTPEMYIEGKDPYAGKAEKLKEEDQKKQRAGISSVIIEGFTRNTSLSTVSSLISELKKLEFVESVDLLSDDMLAALPQKNLEEQLNAVRFAIEVKVRQQ